MRKLKYSDWGCADKWLWHFYDVDCTVPLYFQIAGRTYCQSQWNLVRFWYSRFCEVAVFLLFENGNFSCFSLVTSFIKTYDLSSFLLSFQVKEGRENYGKAQSTEKELSFHIFWGLVILFALHRTPYITQLCVCKFLLLIAGGNKDSVRSSNFKENWTGNGPLLFY